MIFSLQTGTSALIIYISNVVQFYVLTIMRRATWLQVNVVPVVLWVSRWGSCQVVITPSEYIHCAQVQIKRKHCMILHDH